MNKERIELLWPENIVADRHEVSGNWVLHYLNDEQAALCAKAMNTAQPVQGDVECAAKWCEDTITLKDGDIAKTIAVKSLTRLLAAYRTAAEKKAKAEAWDEAMQTAFDWVECEPDDKAFWRRDKLRALPNPYKEQQ